MKILFHLTWIVSSVAIKSTISRSSRCTSLLHLFNKKSPTKAITETVVVPSDYKLATGLGLLAGAQVAVGNLFAAVPIGAIATFLSIQTGRVRFEFDNEAMEVKNVAEFKEGKELLKDSKGIYIFSCDL
jgi:hypothetical protein